MSRSKFISQVLKKRFGNILLLSIMFSSLIVILMVGTGLKDIFYDYLRSDYGNIPDMKIKLNNLSKEDTIKTSEEIRKKDEKISLLYGYEDKFKISIVDSEDLLLASGLSLHIKGIDFSNSFNVLIGDTKHKLNLLNLEYEDNLVLSLDASNIKIDDPKNLKFLSQDEVVNIDFCHDLKYLDQTIELRSKKCLDEIDFMLAKMYDQELQNLQVNINGTKTDIEIMEIDDYSKVLVLAVDENIQKLDGFDFKYENVSVDMDDLEKYEIYNGELILIFKKDELNEKRYKRFLAQLLNDFINYKRMVLKLEAQVFEKDEKIDEEMIYLNELTDFIDMIFSPNDNIAIGSELLAKNLNNFGVLDNFNIIIDEDNSFTSSIRSKIFYNPEKLYDQNILIYNYDVLNSNFQIDDRYNFIDIYKSGFTKNDHKQIVQTLESLGIDYEILAQEDIIPSIKPKKQVFDTIYYIFFIFILVILGFAMYIVLRQFYENFKDELSLFKLFGAKIPYQTFINLFSFFISAFINYLFLLKQEEIINEIMLKYFFIRYEIDLFDYFSSLAILLVFILVMLVLEIKENKKLNLIKGQ